MIVSSRTAAIQTASSGTCMKVQFPWNFFYIVKSKHFSTRTREVFEQFTIEFFFPLKKVYRMHSGGVDTVASDGAFTCSDIRIYLISFASWI